MKRRLRSLFCVSTASLAIVCLTTNVAGSMGNISAPSIVGKTAAGVGSESLPTSNKTSTINGIKTNDHGNVSPISSPKISSRNSPGIGEQLAPGGRGLSGWYPYPFPPSLPPPAPAETKPNHPYVYLKKITSDSILIRWTDKSLVETGYRVERKQPDGNWVEVARRGRIRGNYLNQVSEFTDLLPEREYCFRVVAYNLLGDSGPDDRQTICAETYAVPVSRGCPDLDRVKARPSAPPASACPAPGEPIPIDTDYTLLNNCNYENVSFTFVASDIVFDGNGNTLTGKNGRPTFSIRSGEGSRREALQNIVIRNVNIQGDYSNGVEVRLDLNESTDQALRDELDMNFHDDFRSRKLRDGLDHNLEEELRGKAPHCVHIEDVHIEGSRLYIGSYVHNVTFDRGSIKNSSDVGAYLTFGSRYNTISNSTITGSNREGIAVDSSAFNLFYQNYFKDNERSWWQRHYGLARGHIRDGGGIFLYKNCWENAPEGVPRFQHSQGNVILENEFVSERTGVWIGSRQSAIRTYYIPGSRYTPWEKKRTCGDPVMSEERIPVLRRYYRDYAEDTIVEGNTFTDVGKGVVVEDDRALVSGNTFSGDIHVGIEIGSRGRKLAGDPIYGTTVSDNIFNMGAIDHPITHIYCAEKTQFSNNQKRIPSRVDPFVPIDVPRASCK